MSSADDAVAKNSLHHTSSLDHPELCPQFSESFLGSIVENSSMSLANIEGSKMMASRKNGEVLGRVRQVQSVFDSSSVSQDSIVICKDRQLSFPYRKFLVGPQGDLSFSN